MLTLIYAVTLFTFLLAPALAVDVTYTLRDLGIVEYPVIKNWWGGSNKVQLLVEPELRDLDGDGDSDVVIAFGVFTSDKSADRSYYPIIMENTGDGNLRNLPIHGNRVAQSIPREIAFADFNLDGRQDIIIIGHGYDGPDCGMVGFGDQNILLYSNLDGSYNDVSYLLPQEKAFSHSVTVGDVNGDGLSDIYIGNLSHTAHLLLNAGPDGFRETALPPIFDFFREWPNPVTKYTSCLLVDIDNDGVLEMVLGATGQDGPWGISVIVDQDGQGNFGAYRNLPMGLYGPGTITIDVDAADINGDGLKDLLLSQTRSDPFYRGRGLQILIQRPDGSFADETVNRIIGVDRNKTWIQFASFVDIDKDGDLDILHKTLCGESTGQHEPVVLFNRGDGVFVKSPAYGYPSYVPYSYFPDNGYYGGYDKILGNYFAFVVDFTHYIDTGVKGGADLLRIGELDMVKPY